MKKVILGSVLFLSISSWASVPVSILAFKNKVGSMTCNQDWYWWNDHLGSAFQDMLATEIGNNPNITLLERESIQSINDMEVNLVNSEDSSEKIQKNKFTKARYTLIGSVSGYEYCADKKKLNVGVSAVSKFLGVGGLVGDVADHVSDIGVSKAHAKVIIDVRVVETQTGRVVKVVKAEGAAERKNFKINSDLADYGDASETPVGEAARNAIASASDQLKPFFNNK